jgi:hypothetical protein
LGDFNDDDQNEEGAREGEIEEGKREYQKTLSSIFYFYLLLL